MIITTMTSAGLAASAALCRIGTNRPGIDANPAHRIDASAPPMRCT